MYRNIDFYTKIVEIGLSTGKLAHIENNVNLSFKQTTVSYCWKICIKFKCLVLKYSQANFDRMSLPDFKIMMKQ